MRIRKATEADSAEVKALDTVVPLDATRAEQIDTWLGRDEVLVAEDGQIVGYGVFNHAFFRRGNVDMLMIHPDCRGQKIGEYLLRELENLCDTPKLWVTTNMSNHRMQRLLTRLGYEPAGYIHELDPGDPELIFCKRLAQPR